MDSTWGLSITHLGNVSFRAFWVHRAILVSYSVDRCHRRRTLASLPFLPSHNANRHDAGCRGVGGGRVAAVIRPNSVALDAPGIAKSGGWVRMMVRKR
jgi:hypothetical protein